jgi:3-methyladenine DNA glycosylase/8-oxoguanine DNA glycosylase
VPSVIHRRLATLGVDLDATLRVLTMLPGDPTVRLAPGRLDRASSTPDGPVRLTAEWQPGGHEVEAWLDGDGAEWLSLRLPGVLGLRDDADGFAPEGTLGEMWRRRPGLRVARSHTVWHDLAWLVVQQRIRRDDAARQWTRLVERFGDPAADGSGLRHPPHAARLASAGYHELHPLGIERRRAETLIAAARRAERWAELADSPWAEARRALESLPGVGRWTTSTMAAVTWGDPDAVITGDSGIPSRVAWLLAGEQRADDERMLALLEPFRGHRYRVIQLAFASGSGPPRRHPHPRRFDIAAY